MTTQPIVQSRHIKISASTTVTVWAIRKLGRLVQVIARSPAKWALTALLAVAWTTAWAVDQIAPTPVAAAAATLCLMPLAPLAMHSTNTAGRIRGTVRSLLRYRWRWSSALKNCGVIARWREAPLLLRTYSTTNYDRLRVRMVSGQTIDHYAGASAALAQTFNSLGCRIQPVPNKPHWLELTFLTKDPLVNPVPPFPADDVNVLTNGLPIARREDGTPWRLQLVGTHLLIVGATGAGKSGVLWSIIYQLAPAIGDGLVKLWVLDPKGGMELAPGRYLFNRFARGSLASFANLLDEAVRVMQRRQEQLFGVSQQHVPSPGDPLYVIIVDEMAALTGWNTDRAAHNRIKAALALLQQQGRAAGVVVIGAVQDPRKEILPLRDLFPTRIALRLTEAAQVAMTFGPGAWDHGAKCDEIPASLKGVGYVHVDGAPTFDRVRFAHITPAMIGGSKSEPDEPAKDAVLADLGGFA